MFANFHGLNVKLVSELRKLLKPEGDSKYFVTRKTLVKKLWRPLLSATAEMPKMEGEMAIVYASGIRSFFLRRAE